MRLCKRWNFNSPVGPGNSVTRLSDFWKFFATLLPLKSSLNNLWRFGLFWKFNFFLLKTVVVIFCTTFAIFRTVFYSNIWSNFSLQMTLHFLTVKFVKFVKFVNNQQRCELSRGAGWRNTFTNYPQMLNTESWEKMPIKLPRMGLDCCEWPYSD